MRCAGGPTLEVRRCYGYSNSVVVVEVICIQ